MPQTDLNLENLNPFDHYASFWFALIKIGVSSPCVTSKSAYSDIAHLHLDEEPGMSRRNRERGTILPMAICACSLLPFIFKRCLFNVDLDRILVDIHTWLHSSFFLVASAHGFHVWLPSVPVYCFPDGNTCRRYMKCILP